MDFPPGSIVKRRLHGLAGLFFWHMGVYIGAGLVIHFGGEKKDKGATLCRDQLVDFAADRPVFLHAAPATPGHGRAVCLEAQRVLADSGNGFNRRYHFIFNNCEDFCVTVYQVVYAAEAA